MQRESRVKPLQFLFRLAVAWFFIVGLIILQQWPDLPKTELGWFLLIVAGPLLYIAGEGFFSWLFSEKHGKEISNKQFSFLRVVIAVIVVTVLFGLGIFISSILKQ